MTESNDETTTESKPEYYHYARGAFRRIAEEEYHQPRQKRLRDYWHRPTGEEIVQLMMEKGFSEQEARNAVRCLWREQMRKVRA